MSDIPEKVSARPSKRRQLQERGIFLLPNVLTTCGLLMGLYAIISAIDGLYMLASQALAGAFLFDMLDGSVARWTKTVSRFGALYDSLTDMVSFGIAPAVLVYTWTLSNFGYTGKIVTFLYVLCTALRLARFTIQQDPEAEDATKFSGLPSPGASIIILSVVAAISAQHPMLRLTPEVTQYTAIGVVMISLLMVSNLPYPGGKTSHFRSRISYTNFTVFVSGLGILLLAPPMLYPFLAVAYGLLGPVLGLRQYFLKRKKAADKKIEGEITDAVDHRLP